MLREAGFIKEGLLNYLSLLGWSLSADQDVFTVDELVQHFDVHDVVGNPARFDVKKAEAINGDHIRRLDAADRQPPVKGASRSKNRVDAQALGAILVLPCPIT